MRISKMINIHEFMNVMAHTHFTLTFSVFHTTISCSIHCLIFSYLHRHFRCSFPFSTTIIHGRPNPHLAGKLVQPQEAGPRLEPTHRYGYSYGTDSHIHLLAWYQLTGSGTPVVISPTRCELNS